MRVFTLIALLASLSLSVQAAPASQASIEALFKVTQVEAMLEPGYANMDRMLREFINRKLRDKSLSAEARRALEALPTKFPTIIRDEIGWQKIKPLYVQLYQETFEQEEVDGILAFYASPAGQAMANKLPVLTQKALTMSASLSKSLVPKMKAVIEEAAASGKVEGKE